MTFGSVGMLNISVKFSLFVKCIKLNLYIGTWHSFGLYQTVCSVCVGYGDSIRLSLCTVGLCAVCSWPSGVSHCSGART